MSHKVSEKIGEKA